MPANLTPQYLKAESDYRNAKNPPEQLEALKRMLREIPKHKGTDRMQADLKSKISKLRMVVEQQDQVTKATSQITIPTQGVGRIVMIGPPSSGKSQLLKSMTRAKVNTSATPFSTRIPQVGMIQWEECQIQLVDLPSFGYPPTEFELVQWMRTADLVWIVVDIAGSDFIEQMQQVIEHFASEKTRFGIETALLAKEVGVKNVATILVANQIDRVSNDVDLEQRLQLLEEFNELKLPILPVSAHLNRKLEVLSKQSISSMHIIRVYCKHPKELAPDFEKPLFLRKGDTLREMAAQIHEGLVTRLTGAKIWKVGDQSFQIVKPDYFPCDKDIVELLSA